MSKHEALVVPVELKKHENSDNLSIVKVNDYTCVCRTEDWIGKTKAVYVEPDTLVDVTLPQFSFLAQDAKYTKDSDLGGSFARVKAKKLRGVQSYGLLVPVEDANIGDDFYEKWNMGRYEPKIQEPNSKFGFVTSGEIASAPAKHGSLPKYDVEGALKWARRVFQEGESIVGTLKYHGCFKFDTQVLMSDNTYKNIIDVKKGDKIINYNEISHQFEEDMVENNIMRSNNKTVVWIKLVLDNNKEIICTADHKFLTNSGWIEARNLTEEHDLVSINNS